MRRTCGLFAVCTVLAGALAAQQVPVTLSASLPGESGKPLPVIGRFWFVFDGGRDSVAALTDGTGRARVTLPLGNYRVRSHQRVTLAGRDWYWDVPISIRTTTVAELSDVNAQRTPPAVVPGALVMDAPDNPPARGPEARSAAVAPPTSPRGGFWIGFGFGYGSWSCENCGESIGSFSGTLRLGGTLSPHLRLGVSTNGWYKEENGASLSMGNLSAVLMIYPSATDGFHIVLGLGGSGLSASASGFGSDSEFGGGAVLGIGYDAMVARSFALTPYVNFVAGGFVEKVERIVRDFDLTPYVNFVAGGFNGSYAYFAQIGLAATWP